MDRIALKAGEVVSGERRVSRAQLFHRAAQAATGLAGLGIGPGDLVALLMRNDFPLLEVTIAAPLLGAYAAPVNWHFQPGEVGEVIRDNDAKAVVAHADLLPLLQGAVPAGVPVLAVETPPEVREAYAISEQAGSLPGGATDWNGWLAGFAPHQPPLRHQQLNQVHTIMFSGGTTGRSKAIRRLPITAEQDRRLFDALTVSERSRVLINGPLYHNSPSMTTISAIRAGAAVVLQPRFDAEGLLADIERYAITNVHLVPTMFVRLLKLPQATRRRYDLSSLELVTHGAAPCAPQIKRAMIDWFGPILLEYYGGTETGAITLIDSHEWLSHPGSVGKAVENARIEIVDDDGKVLPQGEIGEIFMWNAYQPNFTYHGQDRLRESIERDGLVTCGDVGYLDREGYLFLCDRKKDMVISAGVNIFPAEIENVLIGLPGVRDCAVFGIPDEEFGEALAAAIQRDPGATLAAAEVKAYLEARIAHYKVPRVIEFCAELPREDSGKIFKRKLRDPYWEKAGRKI